MPKKYGECPFCSSSNCSLSLSDFIPKNNNQPAPGGSGHKHFKIMNKLKIDQNVYFTGEKLPMKVMALSDRFAVVSRKLNRTEDADLIRHQVEMGAFENFTDAYNDMKGKPVYSLLDFEEMIKAPDNLVFGRYDYFDQSQCQDAVISLVDGQMELSERNRAELKIDWERTK